MNYRIKGIAFDLEGTIVDLEPYHWAAHVATAEALGIRLDLDDHHTFIELPHFIGGPNEKVMREILDAAIARGVWRPTEGETVETKLARMKRFDLEHYRNLRDALDKMPPRDGFIEIFERIRALGIPVAIGSLTETQDARIILAKSGVGKLFDPDNIVLKEDVVNVKPNPEVYLRTAERMGIEPGFQLVFEDSHNGIIAAREAGSIPIGIPTIDQPTIIQRLRDAGAVEVFTGWREVNLERSLRVEFEYSRHPETL